MAAGRILGAGLMCFALWVLLDARNLERSASAGALGPRRTLVLAFLRPIRRFSAFISLDRASIALDEALGRHIHGAVGGSDVARALPHLSPSTTLPAVQTASAASPVVLPTAPSTTTTLPLAGPLRQPTKNNPLRVLIVGDSIAKDFGDSLINQLTGTGLVNATLDARPATGLSRPDYFDWNAQLASDLQRLRPELLIAMFGGNDAQSFLVNGHPVQFDTPEWIATYGSRVDQLAGQALTAGVHVLWVGMPAMESSSFGANMQVLNAIDRTQVPVATGPVGGFFDSWPLFVDSSGHYAAYLPDSGGQLELMRQSDGIHLSFAGANRLASAVTVDVQHRFSITFHPAPS
jgi:hypothetical protein